MPFRALSLRLWVVLEHPTFIAGYHTIQKSRLAANTVQEITRNQNPVLLLVVSQNFGNQFGTNFPHLQFGCDDVMDDGFGEVHSVSNQSDTQTAVRVQNSSHFLRIV